MTSPLFPSSKPVILVYASPHPHPNFNFQAFKVTEWVAFPRYRSNWFQSYSNWFISFIPSCDNSFSSTIVLWLFHQIFMARVIKCRVQLKLFCSRVAWVKTEVCPSVHFFPGNILPQPFPAGRSVTVWCVRVLAVDEIARKLWHLPTSCQLLAKLPAAQMTRWSPREAACFGTWVQVLVLVLGACPCHLSLLPTFDLRTGVWSERKRRG